MGKRRRKGFGIILNRDASLSYRCKPQRGAGARKKSHEVAFICECFEKANHYSYSRDQRLKKVQTKIIEVNKNTP